MSIHLLITALATAAYQDWLGKFDWWIALSVGLTAIAHGVRVFSCVRFARRLRD